LFTTVKEFPELVNSWTSYCTKFDAMVFGNTYMYSELQ